MIYNLFVLSLFIEISNLTSKMPYFKINCHFLAGNGASDVIGNGGNLLAVACLCMWQSLALVGAWQMVVRICTYKSIYTCNIIIILDLVFKSSLMHELWINNYLSCIGVWLCWMVTKIMQNVIDLLHMRFVL